MKAKRFLSLIIAVTMIFGFGVTTSAEAASVCSISASPYYLYAIKATSTLSINGATATLKSDATGISSVTKIVIVQTLEKHWALGLFFSVENASWMKTVNLTSASSTNKRYGLDSGTYRLKTEFKFYCGSEYETVTVYSDEKTIS